MITTLFTSLAALFEALAARYNYLCKVDAFCRYEIQKEKVYELQKKFTEETLCDNPNTAFIERLRKELSIEQSYLQYLSNRLPKA